MPLPFLRRMHLMPKKYPSEQSDRSTRMVLDRLQEYPSVWAAAQALAPKLGVGPETLRKWVVQAQVDRGQLTGPSSEELAEIRRLRAENRDLKGSQRDPEGGLDLLREGTRPSPPLICEFIDAMRARGHGAGFHLPTPEPRVGPPLHLRRPGPASSTSRSRSTCTPGRSWDGPPQPARTSASS